MAREPPRAYRARSQYAPWRQCEEHHDRGLAQPPESRPGRCAARRTARQADGGLVTSRSPADVRSAFGEITAGDDEDAIALGDHREVEALFERFEKLEDGTSAERARIVEEICALLTVHAAVEKENFYPALRSRSKEAADLLDEATVEHGTVKELVARLEDMRPGDDLYKANVTVLKEYVQHHVKEEEREMFKLAKAAELDLDRLGRELEKRKLELITAVAMPAGN
ncbi:MAG: hemerythrin domain-containing protein [Casimicrobiaceae bacterium]